MDKQPDPLDAIWVHPKWQYSYSIYEYPKYDYQQKRGRPRTPVLKDVVREIIVFEEEPNIAHFYYEGRPIKSLTKDEIWKWLIDWERRDVLSKEAEDILLRTLEALG